MNYKEYKELYEFWKNVDIGKLLNQLATKRKQKVNILIRLNVGVSAHTHKYIVTAHIDSKF